ncbi:hypothetical protein ACFYV7_35900 [Nocardia suismassiliense]|uniref:HTH araC/xylS-type domain-containing protein n=1 Tax=Nocardia suismassiliense TaxID=2077092 RepID=A0ABW6R3X9_9NOCA
MSVRSLQRHFHDQLGATAQHWLLHARLDRAVNYWKLPSCPSTRSPRPPVSAPR